MLIEIESDAFKENGNPRGKIIFHKGLNSIVATENDNNSTGKSSFLLAIDFAFGGKSYGSEEAKIVKNVSHHTVKFAFLFENEGKAEKKYFSRSTADLNTVNICDSDYNAIENITLAEYHKFLCEKYEFADSTLTFRGAVSPFFRISHKSSKELSSFLSGGKKATARDCVVNFERLFNRFSEIEAEREKASDAQKASATFRDALKRGFIHTDIKNESDLKKAKAQASEMDKELFDFCKTQDEKNIDSALFEKYKRISAKITRLENKISNAHLSLQGLNAPMAENIEALKSFFPSVNMKRLDAIALFHSSLATVMQTQLGEEINRLQSELETALIDYNAVQKECNDAFPEEFFSAKVFNDYGKRYFEAQKIKESIDNYQKSKTLADSGKEAKERLNEKEYDILSDIAESINSRLAALNERVSNGEWKKPQLRFEKPKSSNAKGISRYSLSSQNDEGDGTESANVIMFDMSVLSLTSLPALAHDLFVRNELDDKREEECIKLYALETEKQIFTVFRSLQKYSKEVQDLIEKNTVISLYAGGGELYGTSHWVKN